MSLIASPDSSVIVRDGYCDSVGGESSISDIATNSASVTAMACVAAIRSLSLNGRKNGRNAIIGVPDSSDGEVIDVAESLFMSIVFDIVANVVAATAISLFDNDVGDGDGGGVFGVMAGDDDGVDMSDSSDEDDGDGDDDDVDADRFFLLRIRFVDPCCFRPCVCSYSAAAANIGGNSYMSSMPIDGALIDDDDTSLFIFTIPDAITSPPSCGRLDPVFVARVPMMVLTAHFRSNDFVPTSIRIDIARCPSSLPDNVRRSMEVFGSFSFDRDPIPLRRGSPRCARTID